MILKRKDLKKGMIIRLFNGNEYKILEEVKKVKTDTGQIVLVRIQTAVNVETKATHQVSKLYYDIRNAWNSSKTKMIAKRKHPKAELKLE